MPGARCTRGLACNGDGRGAHEHTGEAESIRHSLRNGFTAYNVISPVSLALLPPSTPTSGRQDHTSLPYAAPVFAKKASPGMVPFVKGTFTSIATPPRVRDDRE